MAASRPVRSAKAAAEAHAPWKPPHYEDHEIFAIKALAKGSANIHQQKTAIDCIIRKIAGTYDLSYRPGPDGDRETSMAEGRRFVGLEVVKLINMPMRQSEGEK